MWLQLLLQRDARVDGAGRGTEKGTPLHAAANGGYTGVLKLLLEHGAETDAVNSEGLTALHSAAGGGHAPAVQLLLAAGSDPAAVAASGATPIDRARAGRKEALEFHIKDRDHQKVVWLLENPTKAKIQRLFVAPPPEPQKG